MISLAKLLPQAAPMVLLDGYEPWTAENTVCAFVDVSPTSPFYEVELGGVPACVALEYMAQTMALLTGLDRRSRGLEPQVGFILGSRKLETLVPRFESGKRYRIVARCSYKDDSFGSFDCEIVDAFEKVCAKGTLTAFQPGKDTPVAEIGELA